MVGAQHSSSVDNEAAPKNSPRNPATQRPGKQTAKQPTTKRPHSEPASKSGQSNRTAGSSCIDSEFGCCDGEEMAKESPEGSNCRWRLGTACSFTAHGCCPDLDIARTDDAGSSCADAAAVVPRAPPAPPPLSPPLFGDTGGCISLKETEHLPSQAPPRLQQFGTPTPLLPHLVHARV